MNRAHRNYFIAFWVCVGLGFIFSAVSTYDFVAHLDRQVHAITCSFVPGLGARDASGSSGCHAAMMSPYSSLFRTLLWGGLPVALMSLSVFAYLIFFSVDIWLRGEERDPEETQYLLAASGLPLAMTIIYFIIAAAFVGALCKLCVGIYLSSAGAFAAAFLAWRLSRALSGAEASRPIPWSRYGIYFAEGVAFVVVPLLLYVALVPSPGAASQKCGELLLNQDKYGVRVKLSSPPNGIPALEVLDPLCPACRAFKQRITASSLDEKLSLEALLMPLDKECNWMVTESLHPGACMVSEAILCGGEQASSILDWSLENQNELRAMAASDPARLEARILETFPVVKGCLGKPGVRSKLNKSLRWAVANSLPVVTPQLYVQGKKICDEDTDLGLEYTLDRLLSASPDGAAAANSASEKH